MNGEYTKTAIEATRFITENIPEVDTEGIKLTALISVYTYLAIIADALEDLREELKKDDNNTGKV